MAVILMSALTLQISVFALGTATAAFLAFGIRSILTSRKDPLRARMERSVGASSAMAGNEFSLAEGQEKSIFAAALEPLAKVARPGSEKELAGIKAKLSHAGHRSDSAVSMFLGSKVLLGVVGALGMHLYDTVRPEPMESGTTYLIVAMFCGFYAPNVWLSGRVSERQAAINLALPDAMDLLVTCVEAGLALEAAITRICGEIRLASPILALELSQASLEMRAGLTRGEAFRRLAERSGVEELKYLSSVIVQAEMFGTSVAQSLRVMSEAMRTRRTQRAEKNAAGASVKMMIPLILCIMPSLFIVILGPAVINILRNFMPVAGG